MELSCKQKELINTSILMYEGLPCGLVTKITSGEMFLIKQTKLLQSKGKCPRIVRVVIK